VLTREETDQRPASAARLVGREAELAAMREHCALAIRGERQTVFVTGEPGIGKSSFVDASLEQVTDRHEFVVIRGQCVEHREPEEPFQPVLEALSCLCRQPTQDRVLGLLAAQAPSWMARMLGTPASTTQSKVWYADEPTAYARMIREMVDVLERIAVESPVALVLEDLQWADNATLALMASLARPRTPAALVVIGTSVPFATLDGGHVLKALKQDLHVHKRCVEMMLPALSTAQVASLLDARFNGARGLADLAALIHANTEGNPLFVSGVIDALIAAGTLARRDKWWELAVQPSAIKISVPDHIHQTLDLQFERLSLEQRRILEAASVVGVEFTAAAVAAALEVDALPIEEWCETLVRRRLYLQSAGIGRKADGRVTARFRFTHTFYQQVFYQRILPRMRIRWHLRIDAHQQSLSSSPPAHTANASAKRSRTKR
jgi:predicted ATPase